MFHLPPHFAPARVACAVLLVCLVPVPPSPAQNVDADWWGLKGGAWDFVLDGTTLYTAGTFTWAGPNTGGGVPLDPGTGQRVPGFPKVQYEGARGRVYDAVSDGAGGWYIVGGFDSVGGVARRNAAHILPDLSVGAWAPDPNFVVKAIVLDGATVYLGGNFTEAGGMPRNNIAAVDTGMGLATTWNPGCDGPLVEDLELHGTSIFVGGTFGTIGGQVRPNLAQIDLVTGLATAWNPQPNDSVLDLEILSPSGADRLYVGGRFTNMGPVTRHFLAEVDISSGQLTSFDPQPNGWVYALAGNDTVLYAGGAFSIVGPLGLGRDHLVEIDLALGFPTNFVCDADDAVTALLLDGGQLYVGGRFQTLCGVSRNRVGRIVLSSGGVDSWDPDAGDWVEVFAPGLAGEIYVGGVFLGINGKTRNYLAAFDTVTGQLSPWNPDPSFIVATLATDGSRLFAGGEFDSVGNTPRASLASFDLVSGALTAWNPTTDGDVRTMAVIGSSLYVGGFFQHVGGVARPYLAEIDVTAGVRPWNPAPNAIVHEVEATATSLYVGGDFTQIDGVLRNHIVQFDLDSGGLTSWNPNASGTVSGVEVGPSSVWVSGSFSTIGGASRNNVAELDASTGVATGWDAAVTAGVTELEIAHGKVWVGGHFGSVQGQSRPRIAAFNLATGTLLPWGPVPDGNPVVAILDDGTNVYIGGDFSALGNTMAAGMAKTDGSAVDVPVTGAVRGGPVLAVSPNPLRGAGSLHFDLRREGEVRLELFDVRGRRVRTLVDGKRMEAGRHSVGLPTGALVPGVYFARWQGAGERAVAKVTVLE